MNNWIEKYGTPTIVGGSITGWLVYEYATMPPHAQERFNEIFGVLLLITLVSWASVAMSS